MRIPAFQSRHPLPPGPLRDRALGSYLGLAVGDALGATVEFMTPREIASRYKVHREIIGGGWLGLRPGDVTDDTGMSLSLGRALSLYPGPDLKAIADAFVEWMRSMPVDIGHTCRRGIRRYMHDGTLCAPPSEEQGGNGAAMRNLPMVLANLENEAAMLEGSLDQAHITHNHPLSDAATLALASMTRLLILGGGKGDCARLADGLVAAHPRFRYRPWPGRTSGYIVDTVQTVFDGFFNTDSFEDCLVRVINRGGDSDTTGAIAGQLAGALYGVKGIPKRWLRKLKGEVGDEIVHQTDRLLGLAAEQAPTLNRCNLPARLIGSEDFQSCPRPLEIAGVRRSNGALFNLLEGVRDPAERRRIFQAYVNGKFDLDPATGRPKSSRSGYSYLNLLRGWGADSNHVAGAVLKAWIESRFGIPASYHNGRLADSETARAGFLRDRMAGVSKSTGVFTQLDLLYTFCQDELRRLFPDAMGITLYRGTHDPEEYALRGAREEGVDGGAFGLVRLNNLSSFTSDREVAWEFGSSAWEMRVPLAKIIFYSGLLPKALPAGESEYLVLGGYYRVRSLKG